MTDEKDLLDLAVQVQFLSHSLAPQPEGCPTGHMGHPGVSSNFEGKMSWLPGAYRLLEQAEKELKAALVAKGVTFK